MAKIGTVGVEQKKNLGNYESQTLTISVVADEDDNGIEVIETALKLVYYKLNEKEIRNTLNRCNATIKDKSSDEKEVAKAKKRAVKLRDLVAVGTKDTKDW